MTLRTSSCRRRSVVAWLTIPLALSVVARASQDPDTSKRAVVDAAATYVASYQQELTSILADEIYVQDVLPQTTADPEPPHRQMISEVFFMFIPGGDGWMAIRDAIAVDGRPIDDRRDIREALRTLPAREVASTFKTHNSRFNIGRTYRNFNEPTLSLLVFDPNHHKRFSFKRTRVHRDGDAVLVTLAFVEKETPTLIRGLTGDRLFSTGEVVVEAGTGRVRHAVLRVESRNLKVELATTYSLDSRLGMWVPTVFRESYEHATGNDSKTRDARRDRERVECEARYSNFRRFETDVRIK